MKAIKIFAVAAAIISAVSCGNTAKPAGVAKDLIPTKGEIDSVSYLLGVNLGSMIKGYNFGDVNYAEIKKGMDDFINAKGNMQESWRFL